MKSKQQLAEDYADNVRPIKGIDKHDAPFLAAFEHHEDVMYAFIAGFEAAKSNLQTDYVDIALRLCNIEINRHLLEKIVDVCSHVLDKGGQATFQDIEELKLKWQSQRV